MYMSASGIRRIELNTNRITDMKRHLCLTLFVLLSVIIGCNKENGQEETNGIPKGAVDMGLSVYWAECNLGAETSYDFGDYYAWGETSVKLPSDYSWTKYKYCSGFNGEEGVKSVVLTKYNICPSLGTVDNLTQLDISDDVAHIKLGGKWRMPTVSELRELHENCTMETAVRNGVVGLEVKSKINGNVIFLPAAGVVYGQISRQGIEGGYWGASLCPDDKLDPVEKDYGSVYATRLTFWDLERPKLFIYVGGYERAGGLSIRPVTK